jgi:hypothetical protein
MVDQENIQKVFECYNLQSGECQILRQDQIGIEIRSRRNHPEIYQQCILSDSQCKQFAETDRMC